MRTHRCSVDLQPAEQIRDHQATAARHADRPSHQLNLGQSGERTAQQHRTEIGVRRVLDRVL